MRVNYSEATDEAEIRALIEGRVNAVRAKDVQTAMSGHSPDVLMFDLVNPLRYTGSDTVKERTEQWFSSYRGPIDYQVQDLDITTGDDVAFCHFLYRVSGTRTDGQNVVMWVRATVCFRKTDGAWKVTHEHDSVPFDPESGKASLDLKP